MGFRTGAFAKVWEVTPMSDTSTKVRMSISRKNKQTGEYEQDFSGFVMAIGTAAASKAARLKEGERIKLGDVDVSTKSVWLWTGYKWEDVMRVDSRDSYRIGLLSNCDVVVDRLFKQELADRKLVWRGSANQRVIDVQASLRAGCVVIYQT